ncbi:hypothetical protein BKD26_05185 [Streptomyces sp. CB03238]|nr:WD40 repeat domain-containing protein [Streptomyces sp. CB03238]ORT60633.1 hypothetical protein BKD26_05185 [Streptomyces sp. CB03238]
MIVDRGEAQLCHDSLLYAWPRLREWISDDRVGLLVRRRLGDAADGWHEAGRPASGLYSGDQLAAARAQLAPGGRVLPIRPVERDFLDAGGRAERRTRNVRRAAVSVVTALAVLASVLAVLARGAQRDAEGRETVLTANQMAAQADSTREEDPQTALRLSLAAYRAAETPQTRTSLYAAYLAQTPVELAGAVREPVLGIAYSADGDVLATSQRRGRVQLWDISRRNAPVRAAHLALKGSAAIAFHPRTRLLAAQTATELALWDVADPADPKRLAVHAISAGTTFTLAFSPDGRTLASGSTKGRLRLWDVSEPSAPRLRSERTVAAVELISLAFGRHGLLVTGNGRSGAKGQGAAQVRLWRVDDPARPQLLDTATTPSVMAVAFHPRRDLVVATGGEGSMGWWTVEGRRLVAVEPEDEFDRQWGYGSALPSLSFRPDGGRLAAPDNGTEGGGKLRDATLTGPELLNSPAEEGTVRSAEPAQSVAYSPDGTHLAVGDVGGNVRAWPDRAPAPRLAGSLPHPIPGTSPVSDDGRFVITGTSEGTHVWDVSAADTAEGADPRLHFTLPGGWEARFFLPGRDGPLLLGHRWEEGTTNHAFRMWTSADPARPPQGPPWLSRAPTCAPRCPQTDGCWWWPVRRARRRTCGTCRTPPGRSVVPGSRSHRSPSRRASSSWAITRWGSWKGTRTRWAGRWTCRIWDLADPGKPVRGGRLEGVAEQQAAYIPSTQVLITDGSAQRAQLWDMRAIRTPRKAARLPAASGGYQPVGKGLLATALLDGTVRFWDVKDPYKPRGDARDAVRPGHRRHHSHA